MSDTNPIQLQGQKILVTGSHGFLGSALVTDLEERGAQVVRLRMRPDAFFLSSPQVQETALSPSCIPAAAEREISNVNACFHLSAFEFRAGSLFSPLEDLAGNAQATLALLEIFRKIGIRPLVVFTSSTNLSGAHPPLPASEDHFDDSANLFTMHKGLSEKYLRYYCDHFQVPSVILRLSNLYGVTDSIQPWLHSTLNRILWNGLTTGKISLFSNKENLRDFIHVEDVVRALIGIVTAPRSGPAESQTFQLGSGQATSYEAISKLLARFFKQAYGKNLEVCTETRALSEMERRNFVADISKASSVLGWKPLYSLENGIGKTLDFLSTQLKEPKAGTI